MPLQKHQTILLNLYIHLDLSLVIDNWVAINDCCWFSFWCADCGCPAYDSRLTHSTYRFRIYKCIGPCGVCIVFGSLRIMHNKIRLYNKSVEWWALFCEGFSPSPITDMSNSRTQPRWDTSTQKMVFVEDCLINTYWLGYYRIYYKVGLWWAPILKEI